MNEWMNEPQSNNADKNFVMTLLLSKLQLLTIFVPSRNLFAERLGSRNTILGKQTQSTAVFYSCPNIYEINLQRTARKVLYSPASKRSKLEHISRN